jgi:hypothetical protein
MFVWPVIALVGILSAVWFFGVRRRGSIGDAAAVRQLLRVAHPEFEPAEVAFDPDGGSALAIDAKGGEIIALFTMGNQVATRVLDQGGVQTIDTSDRPEGAKRVVVRLHDLGCPRLEFTLGAADAHWTARLEHLVRREAEGPVAPAVARVSLPR